MNAPVRTLAALIEGFAEAPPLAVTGLALDSRRVVPGGLFLACRGTRVHGLEHAAAAVAAGASAVVYEPVPGLRVPELGVPTLGVPSLARRAGEIAARFHGHPARELEPFGVTGTDGKTSTAHLVAQALEQLGAPCLYIGTLGAGRIGALTAGDHTTPDAVSLQALLAGAVASGARAASMEVSSHALDQRRVAGIEFHSVALTNVGRDHLDYHLRVEAYAAAKQRLFDLPGLSRRILNLDDVHGARWATQYERVIGYGITDAPAMPGIYARAVQQTGAGLRFALHGAHGEATLSSRLLGRFNVYNLLAAAAALVARGIALADAVRALAAATTVPGRMEGYHTAAGVLVVVDYAHTPQALAQALLAARAHCAGRLSVVFGCGGDRDRGKRPLMGAVAAQHADRVILTDDNPRSEDPAAIVAQIRDGLPPDHPARTVHERADAIARAVREAAAGDVVLVAGKGHEDYQIHGATRRHFSDREFVAGLAGGRA